MEVVGVGALKPREVMREAVTTTTVVSFGASACCGAVS
jgi:hypothetical protein